MSTTTTGTKRKLADAFSALDAAVEPPALKRQNTTARSLYATLAYTPNLASALARAAARAKKVFTPGSSPAPALALTAEYRPSSTEAFIARLETFKLSTYSGKPAAIDSVAAAKCGWTNDGKDRLVCGMCKVSWVVAGKDGMMSKEAANALVEKQRTSLVSAHKITCPWKTLQCDDSIYCVTLQSPAAMVAEVKQNALVLEPILANVEVKHPLSASQLAALRSAVHDFKPITLPDDAEAAPATDEKPSDKAIVTALFGWAPTPPSFEQRYSSVSRPASRAASRAASPFPSTPSRQASFRFGATPASTSTPGIVATPPATPPRQVLRRMSSTAGLASPKRDITTLHCALCQRRIGLWAFAAPTEPTTPPPTNARTPLRRQLDLHKEHRSFCPYVTRSTKIPAMSGDSISASPTEKLNEKVEGWRAVLTVVRRHESVQRQRLASLRRKQGLGAPSMDVDGDAVDSVEALVASAKRQGVRDILSYVKGVIG
ncbi:hypothetical protein MKEN_00369000 [Mycena kentingensis (nom. inval.)]|nr:hypothetical protein MKEN_00369000 [Mycena kentingensis (nom. inval.)]